MSKITIGCAGWDYKDWRVSFYPNHLKQSNYLAYYALYFQFVEINSTFYNLPSLENVGKWNQRVPPKFRFSVKVSQDISHGLSSSELEALVIQFFDRLKPLEAKISSFLVQFPPFFKRSDKHEHLFLSLLNLLPSKYRYAFEFRDNTWLHPSRISRAINNKNSIIATTYLDGIEPYYCPNQEFYYIRLIGDRQLTKFNRIQRKKTRIIEKLQERVKVLEESKDVKQIFIIVNNHFEGFSPETASTLRSVLNLPKRDYTPQKRLEDFF